jgi:peptidoglycan/xylan/chitin deacetylase (PgdA/CDA1 family)
LRERAGTFTGTPSLQGGQEATSCTMWPPLIHLGITTVGVPKAGLSGPGGQQGDGHSSGALRHRAGESMAWPQGKRWVYSITYDEGCAALLDHAVPIHRRFGVPGHVALLASQVGIPRNVPGSSYDGMMILSRDEIHMLAREGWGVSCHSMTHAAITPGNAAYEVAEARGVLEAALSMPVTIFCVPGSNESYPAALAVAAEAGYRAIFTIYDDVNTAGTDLFRLGRVPLHTEYPPPFYSAFDPYRRLHQAVDAGGWVVDYCHCPLPGRTIHPWKDCTAEQLAERFETVLRVGGDEVWLAEPNEVVEHLRSQGV